ncbi:MAG: hypothetical protein Q7T50_04905, partial [Candidatus Magasanikbacteria bacterium]|nr:hypothetical protein [Candidatus Magasanikbacteria bacterium]
MQKTALNSFGLKKGFAPVVLIVIAVVIGLVVVGIASGALKGSFKISKTDKSPAPNQNIASPDQV